MSLQPDLLLTPASGCEELYTTVFAGAATIPPEQIPGTSQLLNSTVQ